MARKVIWDDSISRGIGLYVTQKEKDHVEVEVINVRDVSFS